MRSERLRENLLRRIAKKKGLRLMKSRRRDPRASDHGRYCLINTSSNGVVFGASSGRMDASLDQTERYLPAR
jgi:hypothetical protein